MRIDNFNDPVPGAGLADSHGLWLSGLGALWLYSRGSGLRHVAVLSPNDSITPGGPTR